MLTRLAALTLCACLSGSAAEPLPWSDDLTAELHAAEGDGKPVVVLVRHPADVGSLDAGHWLAARPAGSGRDPADRATAPDAVLTTLLEKCHRVMLWHGSAALKAFPFAPRGGFLFLTAKGEPIAVEEVPPLRAGLKPLLSRILEKPEPLDEKAKAALPKPGILPDPDLKPLPADLKAQFKELLAGVAAAEKDPKAAQTARERVKALLARPMTQDECLHAAAMLNFVIMELDFNTERQQLVEKIRKEAPVGRVAADAYLDVADEAYANGLRDEALKLWQAAEQTASGGAASPGESPTLYRTARAMRALAEGQPNPARKKWEERQVLDVVVLAPNVLSFAKAISCWTDKTFFPVLMKDELYAPKFIAAFKPAQIVVAPAEPPLPELHPEHIWGAMANSWVESHALPARPAVRQEGWDADALRAALKASGVQPSLAAGRFQGFEFLPLPQIGQGKDARAAKPGDQLSKDAALALARQVCAGLERWGVDGSTGWGHVTLAGQYPYRYAGTQDGYKFGNTYALDDLLGRDEDSTRSAVTGRLLGDAARSAYQAACSLFLQPDSALLFNTYGLDPKSIWGAYRMDFSETQWKDRFAVTHLKGSGASIETFRAQVFPWNRMQLLTINSSGGTGDWSVGGGGGTTDDFPVGGPVAIHVTHSGSAGNPYDPDTLAGRAVWGGAFFYFGSVAEPFLSSFQPPRYYAPRIAAGAPFSAAFRQRTGQYFGYPWRLMIIGDPQFCLRKTPARRVPYEAAKGPLVKEGEKVIPPAEYLASVPKWLAGDTAEAAALWQKAQNSTAGQASSGTVLEDPALRYAARVHARQHTGAQMDKALAADDLATLQEHVAALLSTNPARSFVQRWCDQLATLAAKKKEELPFVAWLEKQSTEAKPENFRGVFLARLNQARLAALKRKEQWTADDRAEALRCFAEAVRTKAETKVLVARLEELIDLCGKKLSRAAADAVPVDVKALFPADSPESKRLQQALKELENKSAPAK
ncbi:MAG: hypothetical protein NTW87_28550 [Planctomycetota bacterium]|nr:hypothetical protein [Planctomycetota bacterium]